MEAGINNEHNASKVASIHKSAKRKSSNITPAIPLRHSVPYEEFSHLMSKYNKLLNDNTSLRVSNAEYQKALDLVEQKCRDVQLGLYQWKETAEHWVRKFSSVQKIGSEVASMLADVDKIPSDPRNVSVSFSDSWKNSPVVSKYHVQPTNHNRNTLPSSSQTTEVPDDDQERARERQLAQFVPTHSIEDDSPIVVKSRCLKRKRNSAPETLGQIQEAQMAKGDISLKEIKCEIPSSPVLQSQRPNLITQESTFDLDELGENVKTPRKFSGLGHVKGNVSGVLSENLLHSSTKNINSSRTVNALSAWPVFKATGPRAREENVPKSGNYNNTSEYTDLKGKIVLLSSEKTKVPTTPTNRVKPIYDILRQLSPNIHGSPSRKDISEMKPVSKLPEDKVDNTSSNPNQKSTVLKRSSSGKECFHDKPKSRKRLATMLELAPQKRVILEPELTSACWDDESASMRAEEQNELHEPSFKRKSERSVEGLNKGSDGVKATVRRKSERLSKIANTSRSGAELPPEASQDELNRLRSKPFEQLELDDFKINPKLNQGRDHAFSEVVRGRDMRSCLSGCTKLDCCGRTFQKVIEVAGIPKPTAKRQSLWDETQQDQGEEASVAEETRLLRWFLGEDAKIGSLSETDRKRALLSAQTKAFADQHGKHRHAFERPSTPPGFWRTDMPSTQELEHDRGNAKKTELEKKEERYREAMKPEGKWRFRDEC